MITRLAGSFLCKWLTTPKKTVIDTTLSIRFGTACRKSAIKSVLPPGESLWVYAFSHCLLAPWPQKCVYRICISVFPAIICKRGFIRKTASSLHVATPREDNRATVASNSNMHGKMENLVKFRRAIEISVRTDRQTDRHAYHNTSPAYQRRCKYVWSSLQKDFKTKSCTLCIKRRYAYIRQNVGLVGHLNNELGLLILHVGRACHLRTWK